MGKRPSPERITEYQQLHAFSCEVWAYLIEQNLVLTEVTGSHDPRKNKWSGGSHFTEFFNGLCQGVTDLLEMTKDLSKDQVNELDRRLVERSSISLSEMRSKIWKTIPKILKRGRIRNDNEYYLLKEKVIDLADTALDEESRKLADRLLWEYENEQKGNA